MADHKAYLPFPNLPVHDVLNVAAHQEHLRTKAVTKASEAVKIVSQEDYLKNAGVGIPKRREKKSHKKN
jgi:hypothetical protein